MISLQTAPPHLPLNYLKYRQFYTRIYGIVEIFSILLHTLVHAKIHQYKRKDRILTEPGNQLNTSGPSSVVTSIDTQTMSSLGINLSIIILLASTTMAVKAIGDVEPAKYNMEPTFYLIYYNNFIAPSIIAVLLTVLIFKRNKALRKTVYAEVNNVWSNLMDTCSF